MGGSADPGKSESGATWAERGPRATTPSSFPGAKTWNSEILAIWDPGSAVGRAVLQGSSFSDSQPPHVPRKSAETFPGTHPPRPSRSASQDDGERAQSCCRCGRAIRMVDGGAFESGACVDSNQHNKPSASWAFMRLSTIYSTWDGIKCRLSTIDCSDNVPLCSGDMLLRRSREIS